MLRYLELLQKWNRVYNLSGVRDPHAMVTRHLLDSLAISPYLCGPRVLDVGSGAGLPGIPLALARPELRFVLLDAGRKKARFLRQAVSVLGLGNAAVACERAETFAPTERFHSVVARALAPLPAALALCGRLCVAEGRILVMTGSYPRRELDAIPPAFLVTEVRRLEVPRLGAQRHVVVAMPRSQTP